MQLTTPVSIPPPPFDVSCQDRFLLAGSCFAEEIGRLLADNKFAADVNPFGTLYNPASVASALRRLMQPVPFTVADLFEYEGAYHSFAHHSRFSSLSAEEMLHVVNDRLQASSAHLKNATRLVVTWGTPFVYRLKATGQIVSNCHKLPDRLFEREQLLVDSITVAWEALLNELWTLNPALRLILTVSPIRHWKDGAHANQLGKACLLLAADRLQQAFPAQIAYFPAYEIMLDELRDYRFYAADMLHPSPQAAEYIRERFRQSFFSAETQALLAGWQDIRKALQHVPFRPESESYRRFILQTLLKAEQFVEKFPFFDITNEIIRLQAILEQV